MQKLAEVCIKRPVFATMLVMAFVVVGAASWFRLGVDRFPAVDLPTVNVRVELPGASTEEVETQVAQKLEEQINTIQGINELRSISGSGAVIIIVTFNLNRQIDVAAQDVRDKVAIAVRNLPREILPPIVSKFDNDQAPVVTIALSGERSLRELTEIADKTARPQLERSAGVGEVRIVGGLPRAVNVWVDPDRLAAYQIPITSVRDAVVRQNADLPGGNVTAGLNEASLRTMGRIAEPRAFNDLVVATLNGVPVRVRDIGYAEDGTKEQRSAARLNGVPTVIMEVRRQSGENTVAVIEGVKAKLVRLRDQVPADVKLEVIRDQSRYIYAALHEINLHLVLGSILASLVVLAFMRSWRSTFIAAVAIPTSVISAFGMMWALNFTLNSVTMLALVLMVGIVIDDAIVVLENVFRFVEEKKMRPFEAAREATADIGLAVMATTFSLVVIFVPVSFMSSISGRFLYQFGLTAAVSVLVSLLVSFSLTPMMCARVLRAEDAAGGRAAEGEHARARADLEGPDPRAAAGSTPGQLLAARGDGGAAAALQEVHGHAHAGAQHRRLQHRRRYLRHRPGAARARAREAVRVRRDSEGEGARHRRHRRHRHHAQARQARAPRGHRPPAGGRPARGHPADRDRAAADGRRRRSGLALPRSGGQRRLRCADPADARDPRQPGHDPAALRFTGHDVDEPG